MTDNEVIALAKADAALAIAVAHSSEGPVVFITGNSHMPPLRAFGNAETVWKDAANEDGDLFAFYDQTFEATLEAANVYLGCPPDDNSLYVVDMNRWETIDDPDESETLSGEWKPRTAIGSCPECGSSDVTSTPGTLPVCRSCDWTGWDLVPATAEAETAAILADPETMGAIAEAEADLAAGQEVAVTYTWVVTVLPGQSPGEAVEEYVHSVGWAFDSPEKIEPITDTNT